MVSPLLRRALDATAEALIIPSFTSMGPALRRRLWDWSPLAPDALAGKVVIVTGATSGLGTAIAAQVGTAGAEVVIIGRNQARGASVVAALEDLGATASFRPADLTDPDAVEALATSLAEAHEQVHALVHNAGALVDRRRVNASGIETTWYSMVVAPHLLTRRLADRTDRVVWMSSGGMYAQSVDLDDLGWERRPWNGTKAYAQAKRAQVDLVVEATARGEAPIQVAMHPGWADTPGVASSLPAFHRLMGPLLRDPEQGADTATWLCSLAVEDLEPGAFYLDRRPRATVRLPGTGTSPGDRSLLRSIVDIQAGLA